MSNCTLEQLNAASLGETSLMGKQHSIIKLIKLHLNAA